VLEVINFDIHAFLKNTHYTLDIAFTDIPIITDEAMSMLIG